MEPHEAIHLVEVDLRRLIRAVIGDQWQSDKSIDLNRLRIKQAEEAAKRRGMVASDDLLRYVEFTQLQEIVLNRWKDFEPALGKKKYFDVYMDRLAGFRNPAMHARPLYGFERDLVVGISGEIRNLTSIYMSGGHGGDMKFYPSIELIVDSFHREATASQPAVPQKIPVNVGDTVFFTCHATDPHDRVLTWSMSIHERQRQFPRLVGSQVTYTWDVTGEEVGEMVGVWFRVISDGRYHRWPHFDDEAAMFFEVMPPDGHGSVEQ